MDCWVSWRRSIWALLALFEVVVGGIADPGDELLDGTEGMQALVTNGPVAASVGDGVGCESDRPVQAPS
jgi:hypothetical protein